MDDIFDKIDGVTAWWGHIATWHGVSCFYGMVPKLPRQKALAKFNDVVATVGGGHSGHFVGLHLQCLTPYAQAVQIPRLKWQWHLGTRLLGQRAMSQNARALWIAIGQLMFQCAGQGLHLPPAPLHVVICCFWHHYFVAAYHLANVGGT